MNMRLILIITLILLLAVPAYSAKYAGDPFSLGAGARQLAMGRASIAGPFDGTSGYWNPAGMNLLTGSQITAMHSETFGSLLNHDFVSYTVNKNDTESYTSNCFFHYILRLTATSVPSVSSL